METDTPYSKFSHDELILRDYLAIDRTVMANERTLLSYIRTALAFLVVGGSLIKFLNSVAATVAGCVALVFALVLPIIGIASYRRIQRQIRIARGQE